MKKIIEVGPGCKDLVLLGAKTLRDAVAITLGPAGSLVLIDKQYGSPEFTKDGVSIAREVILKDRFQNMGCSTLRDIASRTVNDNGDGTTTATVLGYAMMAAVGSGSHLSKTDIHKGMFLAVDHVNKMLDRMKKDAPVESELLKNVIRISSNNDESIVKTVNECICKIGEGAQIAVKDGKGMEDKTSISGGMLIERGYESAYFANDEDGKYCNFDHCLVFVSDKELTDISDVETLIAMCNGPKKSSLVIIAPEITGDAFKMLVKNKLEAGLKVVAIKAPSFGNTRKKLMEDICISTGAKIATVDFDFTDTVAIQDYIGVAEGIKSGKEDTILFVSEDYRKEINERVSLINKELKQDTQMSTAAKELLEQRLGKLSGKIGTIFAGGKTEAEMKERRDRIDDAVKAGLAALKQGVIPGGGAALLHCQAGIKSLMMENKDKEGVYFGINVVYKALSTPIETILENANISSSIIGKVDQMSNYNYGINATNGMIVDMFEAGIVDPILVTKSALRNAATVASLIVSTNGVIAEEDEPMQFIES